uniref:Serine carboxypeptidase-like 19 n=1 Tax=Aegilops tauschii TaxID=37682 RepID=M8BQV8_AEGTA
MALRLIFLLCFFSALARCCRFLAAEAAPTLVTRLPGYVIVDEEKGSELFYYFIESEGDPRRDPVVLWLTGGDRCSVLRALLFEIGPLKIIGEPYNGTIPRLRYHPYSWTKVASILFVDSPVGAGFSFSRNPTGYHVGEVSSSLQLKKFLTKWSTEHPYYIANHFYIGGDSAGGKIVPFLAQKISEDIEARVRPLINLKGYLVGNPGTGESIDFESRVPFLHGMGIISDQLYETIMEHCHGEVYTNPKTALCAQASDRFDRLYDEIYRPHILFKKCVYASSGTNDGSIERKILKEEAGVLKHPPPRLPMDCHPPWPLGTDRFSADGGHGGGCGSGSHPDPSSILHVDGRRRDEGSGEGMEDLCRSTDSGIRLHTVPASREIEMTQLPDGGVVWHHGGVDCGPGKVGASVPALEMDKWKTAAAAYESVPDRCVPETRQHAAWLVHPALNLRHCAMSIWYSAQTIGTPSSSG